MAIVREQTPGGQAETDETSISVTWGSTTTAGNLLLAVLQVREDVSPSAVPTGMTLLLEQIINTFCRNWIYYEPDCEARSGAQTFTVDGTTDMTLHLVEYSGLRTSGVLDQSDTKVGWSTDVKSGLTGTTTQADELWFAAMCNRYPETQSSPTNGFTQVNRVHSANASAGSQLEGAIYEKIVSGVGTAEVWATIAESRSYGGLIVTLKAATGDVQLTAGNVAAAASIPTPTAEGDVSASVTPTTVSGAAAVPGSAETAAVSVTPSTVVAASAVPTPAVTAITGTVDGTPIVDHQSAAGWIRDPRQSRFLFMRPPFTNANPGDDPGW